MLRDVLSPDPATNGTRPPPTGAPQGGTDIGDLSATLRWLMAGAAELLAAFNTSVGRLKGLAFQDPGAVAITGGTIAGTTIGSSNHIDAAALTSGTLDPARIPPVSILGVGVVQALYDGFWPVGSQRAWHSVDPTGLTPAGLTASWTRIAAAEDALLAAVGSTRAYGAAGTGTSVTMGTAGGHNHGGNTAAHTLTLAEVPAPILTGGFFQTPPDNPQQCPFGTQQSLDLLVNSPGGGSHAHGVSTDGAHTHALTMPSTWATYWYERTA